MSTLDLARESRRNPADVISDVALSDEAVALMPESANTLAYLENLCGRELYADAFLTLGRTLPRQYAIIWATKCVEELCDPSPRPEDQRCLDIVKQWLANPDDKIRRAAMDSADACEYEGPWAWLAASVGFSGGSMAPENQAEIPPPAQLTAVAVSACLISISTADPEKTGEVSRDIVNNGLSMAAIPSGSEEAN